jgi:hypothetical protein
MGMILVGSLAFSTVMAQETVSWHRNYMGITVSELPFLDFRLSYEYRFSEIHSLKIELGYKILTKYFTNATAIDLGLDGTGWCYRNTANWYYISLGYKYYFARKKTFYLSPEVFYKYMTTGGLMMYSWGIENDGDLINGFEIRSMTAHVAGFNMLIGKKIRFRSSKRFNMGFDIFTGITGRVKIMQTKIYGHLEAEHSHDSDAGTISIPVSDDPTINNDTMFQFMAQFGIIFYGAWR